MSEFDDVFRNKNNEEKTIESIPPILMKYFNKDLPDGIEYKDVGKGQALLFPTKSVNISGITYVMPNNLKKILERENRQVTFDLVREYAYNAQIKVKLRLLDGENIIFNGNKIKPKDIMKSAYNSSFYLLADSLYLMPPSFDSAFYITLGYDGYQKEILIKRVPNPESIYTAKFESANEECLNVVYYVDQEKHTIKLTMNIRIKKAKSVQDIIDSVKMFYEFSDGHGYIFDKQIKFANVARKGDEFGLQFWEHARALEDMLNISFKVPKTNRKDRALERIEELYYLLILNKSIRDRQNYSSFNINMSKNNDLENNLGKELFISFTQEVKETLLSAKIRYYTVNGLYNAKLDRFEVADENYTAALTPVEGKKMYVAKKAFLNEPAVDDKEIQNQLLNEIRLAQTFYEIVENGE